MAIDIEEYLTHLSLIPKLDFYRSWASTFIPDKWHCWSLFRYPFYLQTVANTFWDKKLHVAANWAPYKISYTIGGTTFEILIENE